MKPRRVQADEFVYVCRADRELPAAQQTRIRCKPMSIAWEAKAYDDVTTREDGTVRLRNYQVALEIAREHIVAVDNFAAGKWPADGGDDAKDKYLLQMGPVAIHEIGHAIWDQCSLDTPPDSGAPPLGES